jgi:hypothetical protein
MHQRVDLTLVSDELVKSIRQEMQELPKSQRQLADAYKAMFSDLRPPTFLSVVPKEDAVPPHTP